MTRSPDLLEAIVAGTRCQVERRRERVPIATLHGRAAARPPQGARFQAALTADRVNVIAECKRRSPSRGVLRREYDPAAIARAYAAAGAAAVSVLTEPTFFDGALEHLEAVRQAVADLPLLRKDFIVDQYQLVEAAAWGADAVLLIVSSLDDDVLRRLHAEAEALGLAILVEVHDRDELARALDAGARLVGVNNRNLRTLEVHLRASEELAPLIPPHVMAVSESGLQRPGDLSRLRGLGYRAFLVGERLMAAEDPGAALAALLGSDA